MYIGFFITNNYKPFPDPSVYTFAPHNLYEFNYRQEMILKRYLRRLLNYINLRVNLGKWHFDAWRRHIVFRIYIPYQITDKKGYIDQYEKNLEEGAAIYELYSPIVSGMLEAFENSHSLQELDEKMKQLYEEVKQAHDEYANRPENHQSQESLASTASTSLQEIPLGLPEFIESNAKQADQLKSIVPFVLSRAECHENQEVEFQTPGILSKMTFTENQQIRPVTNFRDQDFDLSLFNKVSEAMIDSLCNQDYDHKFQEVNIFSSDEIRVNFHGSPAEVIEQIRVHIQKLLPNQEVDIDPINVGVKEGVAKFQRMRQFTHHSVIKFLFLLKNEWDSKHYIIKEKPRKSLLDHVSESENLSEIQLLDYFEQINIIIDNIRRENDEMPHLNINVKNVYVDRDQIKLSEPFCCQVSLDSDHQHPNLKLENTKYKSLQAYEVWGLMQVAVFLLSKPRMDHLAGLKDFAENDRTRYSSHPIMFIPEDLQNQGRESKSETETPIQFYSKKLIECLHRGGITDIGEKYRKQLRYYMIKIKNEREIEKKMGSIDFLF